jgi:hypothetical protein
MIGVYVFWTTNDGVGALVRLTEFYQWPVSLEWVNGEDTYITSYQPQAVFPSVPGEILDGAVAKETD